MAAEKASAEVQEIHDEEKAFLLQQSTLEDATENVTAKGLSYKFWLSSAVNTISTIAIVRRLPRTRLGVH